MSDNFKPMPLRTPIINSDNNLSDPWRQFFAELFEAVFERLNNIEKSVATNVTDISDHETRIDALENP